MQTHLGAFGAMPTFKMTFVYRRLKPALKTHRRFNNNLLTQLRFGTFR